MPVVYQEWLVSSRGGNVSSTNAGVEAKVEFPAASRELLFGVWLVVVHTVLQPSMSDQRQ